MVYTKEEKISLFIKTEATLRNIIHFSKDFLQHDEIERVSHYINSAEYGLAMETYCNICRKKDSLTLSSEIHMLMDNFFLIAKKLNRDQITRDLVFELREDNQS